MAEAQDEATAQWSNVLYLQEQLHDFVDRLSSATTAKHEATEQTLEERYLYQERLATADSAAIRHQEQLEATRDDARQLWEQMEAKEITIPAFMLDNLHIYFL